MIYALEPYFGGSHKQFLLGLKRHIRLPLTILPMTPHRWKWRMQNSPVYYADLFHKHNLEPGTILASDFVNLTSLKGLIPNPDAWRWVLYFHENQLTYPFRDESERDLTYAQMNILSALTADSVYFNSRYHLNDFISAIPEFYARFGDYIPQDIAIQIRQKAKVLPVGLDLKQLDNVFASSPKDGPGVILWNQRWEHDKNPEAFFKVLFRLSDNSIPFRLIVCGQQYKESPKIFRTAKERLKDHILHWGYVESTDEYSTLLHRADIVVSTAVHEFFGVAVLEAIYCNNYPLLPGRLVYPEYIPENRKKNLYSSEKELFEKLRYALENIDETREINVSSIAAKYDWSEVGLLWEMALSVLG